VGRQREVGPRPPRLHPEREQQNARRPLQPARDAGRSRFGAHRLVRAGRPVASSRRVHDPNNPGPSSRARRPVPRRARARAGTASDTVTGWAWPVAHVRSRPATRQDPVRYRWRLCRQRGRSSMAEPQPSKLVMRVRFPSPAPPRNASSGLLSVLAYSKIRKPQSVGVPVACPMEGPLRAALRPPASPPELSRSPRPGRGRRAGTAARRGSSSGPSAGLGSCSISLPSFICAIDLVTRTTDRSRSRSDRRSAASSPNRRLTKVARSSMARYRAGMQSNSLMRSGSATTGRSGDYSSPAPLMPHGLRLITLSSAAVARMACSSR
jgi:hypothetical protein